ncbi:MAG TPA: hypothetical protein VGR12_00980 [Solirubrobacteraceae bacterium]|nr:hypothetical protein [Solirubrobacteraceae bacterium]
MRRRAFVRRVVALVLGASSAAGVAACGGRDPDDEGMGGGMMDGPMPDWMMSAGGMDRGMREDMRVIRRLLRAHRQIDRAVADVPGGVRTRTVSDDPEIAALIRTHVRQMKARVEAGEPIRGMDPLFREIFEHHREIEMEVEDVPGGVRVRETSDEAQVVLLIRQHARRAVSEFVRRGMRRAMQRTPLPPGYRG